MPKAATSPSTSERIGRFAGRAWRRAVRGQKCVALWLTSKGVPAPLASALSLLMAVVVLGVLAHVAFWLALLLVIGVAFAWGTSKMEHSTQDQQEPEWRDGPTGFGLYTYDGHRIDPRVNDE